jgi:hypothetical protein
VRFQLALTGHFYTNCHAVRVDATHRVVVFEVSRLTREAAAQGIQFNACRHTPRHFPQRRTFFERRRQRRIVRVDDQNRATVQRFKARAGFIVCGLFQTPVGEKTPTGFEIRYTVGNLFNAKNRHVVPLT